MNVEPYLFFNGRCEEALDFYRRVLGAEVGMLMRFKESPEPWEPGRVPSDAGDKIMHASFRVGEAQDCLRRTLRWEFHSEEKRRAPKWNRPATRPRGRQQ